MKGSEWEATLWKISIGELGCKDRDKVPLEIQGDVLLPCIKHGKHLNKLLDIGEGDGYEPVITGEG